MSISYVFSISFPIFAFVNYILLIRGRIYAVDKIADYKH